jgi:hypothetical protein
VPLILLTNTLIDLHLLRTILHCTISYCTRRPGLLNTREHFKKVFQDPIDIGSKADSQASDQKHARRRTHVLQQRLKPYVNRKDSSVLLADLKNPPQVTITACTVNTYFMH